MRGSTTPLIVAELRTQTAQRQTGSVRMLVVIHSQAGAKALNSRLPARKAVLAVFVEVPELVVLVPELVVLAPEPAVLVPELAVLVPELAVLVRAPVLVQTLAAAIVSATARSAVAPAAAASAAVREVLIAAALYPAVAAVLP